MLLRRVARPLLASVFVVDGVDTLMHPETRTQAADTLVSHGEQRLPDSVSAKLPADPSKVVRINAVVRVGAGTLLALGRAPRISATVLAVTVVPATVTEQDFWNESEAQQRAAKRTAFLKDMGLLGGLLIAAADTEGKASLGRRGRRAAREAAAALPVTAPGKDKSGTNDKAVEITEKMRDRLQHQAGRGRELATAAADKSADLAVAAQSRGGELAETAREHGGEWAENARHRGAQWAGPALEHRGDWADTAKRRGAELAGAAREHGGELAGAAKRRGAELAESTGGHRGDWAELAKHRSTEWADVARRKGNELAEHRGEWAELAKHRGDGLVGAAREHGGELAHAAKHRSTELTGDHREDWAELAKHRGTEWAEAAREHGGDWAELARRRGSVLARQALERTEHAAGTARERLADNDTQAPAVSGRPRLDRFRRRRGTR